MPLVASSTQPLLSCSSSTSSTSLIKPDASQIITTTILEAKDQNVPSQYQHQPHAEQEYPYICGDLGNNQFIYQMKTKTQSDLLEVSTTTSSSSSSSANPISTSSTLLGSVGATTALAYANTNFIINSYQNHSSNYLDYKSDQENTTTNNSTTNLITSTNASSSSSSSLKPRAKQRKDAAKHSNLNEQDLNIANYNNMVSMAAAANANANANANENNIYYKQQQQPSVSTITNTVDLNNNDVINTSYHHYANNGGAIKRGCEDVDCETEDDLKGVNGLYSASGCSSSSSMMMSSGRRSPAKKPKFIVTYKEMREFFNLLNEESIREFLKRDSCCLISDKYALAMVFTYFKRAKFYLNEYNRLNFYLALYLASDIEEDVDEYKYEIFPWALGNRWRQKFSKFLRQRDGLLRRIGYRAIVSRKCCEEVMSLVPDHCIWKRERSEDHGGATRAYLISRSRRFLSSTSNTNRANIDHNNNNNTTHNHNQNNNNIEVDAELNLPRGPNEKPRPCPLCLVNRSTNSTNKQSISLFNPSISKYSVSSSSGYHSISSNTSDELKSSLSTTKNEDEYEKSNELNFINNVNCDIEQQNQNQNHQQQINAYAEIHFNEPIISNTTNLTNGLNTTNIKKKNLLSDTPRNLLSSNDNISYGLDVLTDGGGASISSNSSSTCTLSSYAGDIKAPCNILPSSNKFVKVTKCSSEYLDLNNNFLHKNTKITTITNPVQIVKHLNYDSGCFMYTAGQNFVSPPQVDTNETSSSSSSASTSSTSSSSTKIITKCAIPNIINTNVNFNNINHNPYPITTNTAIVTTIKCPSSTSLSNYIISGSEKNSDFDDDNENDEVFTTATKLTSKSTSSSTTKKLVDTLNHRSNSNSNSTRHKTKYSKPIISSSKKKMPFSLSSSAVLTTTTSSTTGSIMMLNDQLVPREILLNASSIINSNISA